MKTVEIKIYEYNELNEKSKENVKNKLMMEYFWIDEAIKSLESFAYEVGIDIKDYSIDSLNPYCSYIKWNKNYNYNTKFIKQDLTGYYLDYVLTKTWNKTKDVDECISEFLNQIEEDHRGQFNDDYVNEHCEANQYEFTKDGKLY